MTLFDVIPAFAMHDSPNGAFGNAVFVCKLMKSGFAGDVSPSNFANDFRRGMRRCMPTFRNHVVDIIKWSTEKQVVRPNTLMVVTAMKYPLVIWDRTIGQHPRNSVSLFESAIEKECPVSVTRFASGPIPTSIGSGNPRPESVWSLSLLPFVHAGEGAVLSDTDSVGINEVGIAAELTGTLDGHLGFPSRIRGVVPTGVSALRRLSHSLILPQLGAC